MKKTIAAIIILCLLFPMYASAEMAGQQIRNRIIDGRNQFLYATYDRDNYTFYFWLPGKLGFNHIYQYHPSSGWKWLTSLWNSELKTMIYADGYLYYTLYAQLNPRGVVSTLYALNTGTGRVTSLLSNVTIEDVYAASKDKVLFYLRAGKGYQPGFYYYSLSDKQLTPLDWSEFSRVEFGEKGSSFQRAEDNVWVYYDYNTERIEFDSEFVSTTGSVYLFSPEYWVYDPCDPYGHDIPSFYLNGDLICQSASEEGSTLNEKYAVWYNRTKGEQRIQVLDVYASDGKPQIDEYDVCVMSNIFILDHYAVMLSDVESATITIINLEDGKAEMISPYSK